MVLEAPIHVLSVVAPLVRAGFWLMPRALRKKRFWSRLGLKAYAKTLQHHFEAMDAGCNRATHWLAIDRAAAILDRLSIQHPEKSVGPAVWQLFLARVVAASEEMDIDRARDAILDKEWDIGKHEVNAGPANFNFDVPASKDSDAG